MLNIQNAAIYKLQSCLRLSFLIYFSKPLWISPALLQEENEWQSFPIRSFVKQIEILWILEEKSVKKTGVHLYNALYIKTNKYKRNAMKNITISSKEDQERRLQIKNINQQTKNLAVQGTGISFTKRKADLFPTGAIRSFRIFTSFKVCSLIWRQENRYFAGL